MKTSVKSRINPKGINRLHDYAVSIIHVRPHLLTDAVFFSLTANRYSYCTTVIPTPDPRPRLIILSPHADRSGSSAEPTCVAWNKRWGEEVDIAVGESRVS